MPTLISTRWQMICQLNSVGAEAQGLFTHHCLLGACSYQLLDSSPTLFVSER